MKKKSAHQPSSATSCKEGLSEETINRLRDILPMLEKNIADLVQDVDSMQRVFLAIKDNLSPDLIKVLSPLCIIEDQAPKVKKAQRNLSNRETLMTNICNIYFGTNDNHIFC